MALEMPPRVRAHLGLDDERCWIVLNEYNLFTWPGPDIRPIARNDELGYRYGSVPGKLLDQIRDRIKTLARGGKLKGTTRTE
jgi:hypothetical protein